jgi:hypothetical protein
LLEVNNDGGRVYRKGATIDTFVRSIDAIDGTIWAKKQHSSSLSEYDTNSIYFYITVGYAGSTDILIALAHQLRCFYVNRAE